MNEFGDSAGIECKPRSILTLQHIRASIIPSYDNLPAKALAVSDPDNEDGTLYEEMLELNVSQLPSYLEAISLNLTPWNFSERLHLLHSQRQWCQSH